MLPLKLYLLLKVYNVLEIVIFLSAPYFAYFNLTYLVTVPNIHLTLNITIFDLVFSFIGTSSMIVCIFIESMCRMDKTINYIVTGQRDRYMYNSMKEANL